ncbi:MAG: hypothetical protein JOZ24_12380 [Candidatus Eremiobacteraeota bacterium]|nr:hypothetical protein [Candidatus Eremiobacteraeota bacterium]
MRAAIVAPLRAAKEGALERVRWTVALGARFDEDAFARALAGFRRLYNVAPERVLCAPDVLARFAELYASGTEAAHRRALLHLGVPVVAAILAPGTAAFEGEIDEGRMGDW